jgi:hypothetical protein
MENNRYVAYSVAEGWWIVGSMDRSCFAVQIDQESNIIGFDIDGDSFFHERGVDANGEALPWYMESGYSDIDSGNERMDVFACIPDFKRHSEDITLTLTSKDYPTDTADEEVYVETLTENIGILDVRMSGRQIKKRLAGSSIGSDFRLGRLRLEVNDAGGTAMSDQTQIYTRSQRLPGQSIEEWIEQELDKIANLTQQGGQMSPLSIDLDSLADGQVVAFDETNELWTNATITIPAPCHPPTMIMGTSPSQAGYGPLMLTPSPSTNWSTLLKLP